MMRAAFTRSRLAAASAIAVVVWQLGTGTTSRAQQAPSPPLPPEAPAPTPPSLMTLMAGPLTLNPDPVKLGNGSFGPIYGTGVLTGLGLAQTNAALGDRASQLDISNGVAIVQKVDGFLQFYAQAGIYTLPVALGAPYIRASTATSDLFGPLPEGFLKLAPTDAFSLEGGKLWTLYGAEYIFTFENMNIEHGLLTLQEPAISRGVQANYTVGPLAWSASFNDGFYSDRFNWLVGSATWTIDSRNTLTAIGGGNLGHSTTATLATPLAQNNSDILNLIYTYSDAPWTIIPYFQFTHVPKITSLGFYAPASTYGGSVIVNYALTPRFNLAGRAEIIASTGNSGNGAPNLLYGPGSYAFSLTVTPAWQLDRVFVRAEGSLVDAGGITPGLAFGKSGNRTTQARFLVETGFLF